MKSINDFFPELVGEVVKIRTIQRKRPSSDELDYSSTVQFAGTLEGYRISDETTQIKLRGMELIQLFPKHHFVELYVKEEEGALPDRAKAKTAFREERWRKFLGSFDTATRLLIIGTGPRHPDHPDHEHEDCCK